MTFEWRQSVRQSRLVALGCLFLWMAIIFSFSMMTGKVTAGPPPLWYFLERKSAHVFEYAVLMLLSYRFFHLSFVRERIERVLVLAAGFAIMYAATDELHQFFVPNRGASLRDILIDGGGVLLAVMGIFLLKQYKNRSR